MRFQEVRIFAVFNKLEIEGKDWKNWLPVLCSVASSYLNHMNEKNEMRKMELYRNDWWKPSCVIDENQFRGPTSKGPMVKQTSLTFVVSERGVFSSLPGKER